MEKRVGDGAIGEDLQSAGNEVDVIFFGFTAIAFGFLKPGVGEPIDVAIFPKIGFV